MSGRETTVITSGVNITRAVRKLVVLETTLDVRSDRRGDHETVLLRRR